MYALELSRVYYEVLIELLRDRTLSDSGYLKKIADDFLYLTEKLSLNVDKVYFLSQSYMHQYYSVISKSLLQCYHPTAEKGKCLDTRQELHELNVNFVRDVVNECLKDADRKRFTRINLILKSITDAISPKNNALLNRTILNEIYKTNGLSLLTGMNNLLEDIKTNKSILRISVPPKESFTIGVNIAYTEGKVIFENDYIQLIYYKPLQEEVYSTPILIVPPWINKFYIFDLDEKSSLVKWLLEKGYSVFIMSWVNPNKDMKESGMEEYLSEGAQKAMEVVKNTIGAKQMHLVGYCVSSAMVTMLLSIFESNNDNSIKSATLLANAVDFDEISDISAFLDEEGVGIVNSIMSKQGYINGEQLNAFFAALRTNDMVWRFVNTYLTGKREDPLSVIYWNSDSVRVTAKLHSFFISELYLKNNLAQPNALKICSSKINISNIKTPIYCVGTVDDYIIPWKSAYKGYSKIGSKNKKFILSGSGHVLGIINPPSKNKYYYFHDESGEYHENPEDWRANAKEEKGSWWGNWTNWLNSLSTDSKCKHNYDGIKEIEKAPGRYVLEY